MKFTKKRQAMEVNETSSLRNSHDLKVESLYTF